MDSTLLITCIPTGLAIVNFIATKVYGKVTGEKKDFIWRTQFNTNYKNSHFTFDELKRIIRIVVIDDEDNFPTSFFKLEGYAIDKFDKVTTVGFGKLESGFYDIIILDIKGVAQDISELDGLGVLDSLKNRNPAQIIVAYSQHSYDLSKSAFFERADETIAKPSDFLKIKGTIDTLIEKEFKVERYIDSLRRSLEQRGLRKDQIKKFENHIGKMIREKKQPNWQVVLSFINDNRELIKQITSVSDTILKFFK